MPFIWIILRLQKLFQNLARLRWRDWAWLHCGPSVARSDRTRFFKPPEGQLRVGPWWLRFRPSPRRRGWIFFGDANQAGLNWILGHVLGAHFILAACFLLFFPAVRKDHHAAMKRIFILIAVVAAAAARADLVTQQQITTPNYSGVATIKIKGTKVRMDMYAGQPQALSRITDLNTGEIIILMHAQKMYVKAPGQPMQQTKPATTA